MVSIEEVNVYFITIFSDIFNQIQKEYVIYSPILTVTSNVFAKRGSKDWSRGVSSLFWSDDPCLILLFHIAKYASDEIDWHLLITFQRSITGWCYTMVWQTDVSMRFHTESFQSLCLSNFRKSLRQHLQTHYWKNFIDRRFIHSFKYSDYDIFQMAYTVIFINTRTCLTI